MSIGCILKKEIPKRTGKVIILDGPDGVGKSHIAKALAKELSIPYFRMETQHENWRNGKFKEALEFDQTYIASFLAQTGHSVIIDRAYPAEWVYSRVYSRETNKDVLKAVDAMFARMGAYIIIPLRRDYSQNKKDELVKQIDLECLHAKYIEFRDWTRCNTITICVDDFGNDVEQQVPLLIKELDFSRDLNVACNVTLESPRSLKDNSHLFKIEEMELKTIDLKFGF